ncbi:MAG: hypothetical protein IJU45_07435 [Clostridia bacterium]|nr:hypothetical protein [Clostridia bacterium]
MRYEKPNLEVELFTIKDALMAETISATDAPSGDNENDPPSFETLSNAIDILFGN